MSDLVSSDRVQNYRLKQCLRALGATPYVISRPEVSKLDLLLQQNELVKAFICGTYISGWSMFIATDKKLLFIEKTPLRLKVEELSYEMVKAVDYSTGRKYGKVTVHAQRKDYYFRRVKIDCIEKFVSYVESRMQEDKRTQMEGLKEIQNLDPRFDYSSSFHIPAPHN